jgi:hypothetical protein
VSIEELGRRRRVEWLEAQLRKVGGLERVRHVIANGEQQDDRLEVHAPRHEREHVARRVVEPVRVLSHDQKWRARRSLAEQLERGERDQERVRRRAVRHPEGGLESRPVRARQRAEIAEQRLEKLVEPRKGQVRLRLHARHAQHRHAGGVRPVPGGRQQRRLSDSRVAADHQGTAAVCGVRDQLVERGQLGLAGVEGQGRHPSNDG